MASATMCAYLVVSGMKEKSGVHVFGILWKHTTSVCIRVFTRETTKVSVTYLFLFPKPTWGNMSINSLKPQFLLQTESMFLCI